MRYNFDNMLTLSDVAENPDTYIRNKAIGFDSIIVQFSPLYIDKLIYDKIKIPRMMVFNKTTGLYDIVLFTSNVKPVTELDMLADRPITIYSVY